MPTFRTFGSSSDATIIRVPLGIPVTSYADPSNPVVTPRDWSASYSSGAKLDGASNTLPSLQLTITNQNGQFATVYQGNLPVLANGVLLPFTFVSAEVTVPYVVFNVPRVPGTYQARIIYTEPNGVNAQQQVREFTVTT